MSNDTTCISVRESTREELYERTGPGRTYDDVVQELLQKAEQSEN